MALVCFFKKTTNYIISPHLPPRFRPFFFLWFFFFNALHFAQNSPGHIRLLFHFRPTNQPLHLRQQLRPLLRFYHRHKIRIAPNGGFGIRCFAPLFAFPASGSDLVEQCPELPQVLAVDAHLLIYDDARYFLSATFPHDAEFVGMEFKALIFSYLPDSPKQLSQILKRIRQKQKRSGHRHSGNK